jgi:2,5-diamino-6-(ribosylamino)-4(3H)-pyrimidinone 5'-phosphate reductase
MFIEEGRTIICVSLKADKERVKNLEEKAEVMACGKEKVDLKCLMNKLYERGVRRLLLEGGGNLNWGMLKEGLVDEVNFAIAPRIAGGRKAVSLVEGEGFSTIEQGVKLELKNHYHLGSDFVMEYMVLKED